MRDYFVDAFGLEFMESIPLLVDNATSGSGYTPIITRTLERFLVIKLHVEDGGGACRIVFQFAHELMHYTFFVKYGIDKERADSREESICSAASLIVLFHLCPDNFGLYNEYVKALSDEGYRKGAVLAEQTGYDLNKLKEMM